jgi:hypothetical protein
MQGPASSILSRSVAEPKYEDGTNILSGTPFEKDSTTRVLPWYDPSQSTAPEDWREKWRALRARFERLLDDLPPIESILVQTRIPAFGRLANDFPLDVHLNQLLLSCNGLELEPTSLTSPDGSSLTACFPLQDVRGNPLLNPKGENMPFRLGLTRYVFVQLQAGRLADVRSPHILSQLATDATNLLYRLPSHVARGLWRNWLGGFSKTRNAGHSLWFDALFELSWQGEPGSPLYARRSAWKENVSIGLIGDGVFPRLSDLPDPSMIPNDHGYPAAYFSKINDVVRASIAAIDELLDRDKTANMPSRRRFRVGLSFPGEHRHFVAQVARQLGTMFGEKAILYDQFHEAEFAQPGLDIYLPELYRKDCDLIAVFLCAEYKKRRWCKLEWRFIRQLIEKVLARRIMLFRFDGTFVPGVLEGDGYVFIGDRNSNAVTKLILERLQLVNKSKRRRQVTTRHE